MERKEFSGQDPGEVLEMDVGGGLAKHQNTRLGKKSRGIGIRTRAKKVAWSYEKKL